MHAPLDRLPVSARYLRISMIGLLEYLRFARLDPDPRICVGYAIRELYAGSLGKTEPSQTRWSTPLARDRVRTVAPPSTLGMKPRI